MNDLEKTALEGIACMENYYRELGLPVRLKEIGIDDANFEEMASKCTEGGPIGQFVKLEKDDIIEIYKLALNDPAAI